MEMKNTSVAIRCYYSGCLDLRNQIEFEWNSDFEYSKIKKNLKDYIIVNQYFSDTGMLKYHRDFPKKTN